MEDLYLTYQLKEIHIINRLNIKGGENMNRTIITILTASFTIICFIGMFITFGTGEQGTFTGGLMVGCFWLGWLMKSK
jgi:hypothetical protein